MPDAKRDDGQPTEPPTGDDEAGEPAENAEATTTGNAWEPENDDADDATDAMREPPNLPDGRPRRIVWDNGWVQHVG